MLCSRHIVTWWKKKEGRIIIITITIITTSATTRGDMDKESHRCTRKNNSTPFMLFIVCAHSFLPQIEKW